jgi:hypothetical protein
MSEHTIIESSEIKIEQDTPKVIKRIRKKKGEVKDKSVILENEIVNTIYTDTIHPDTIHPDTIHPDTIYPGDTPEKLTIVKEEKVHKKRGRKPKGGKIIINNNIQSLDTIHEYNIILHLKCSEMDLTHNNFLSSINYDPNVHAVETFQFENSKELNYQIINNESDNSKNINTFISGGEFNNTNNTAINGSINNTNKISDSEEFDHTKHLWKKIKELTINLHKNNIQDKKSDCFWCTCAFDNPPLYIPKYELNNIYYCYGCFCSPECATAFLFKETIDTSTRFERYHLLNHIYCKIYNYTKNIKPAPDPYYTLNKYYGNLTIQEYRLLLKNERILIVVDKPLSRILPELHEDNDDFINNLKIGSSSSNKFQIKKKTK